LLPESKRGWIEKLVVVVADTRIFFLLNNYFKKTKFFNKKIISAVDVITRSTPFEDIYIYLLLQEKRL
jgi:hypothetical protein